MRTTINDCMKNKVMSYCFAIHGRGRGLKRYLVGKNVALSY